MFDYINVFQPPHGDSRRQSVVIVLLVNANFVTCNEGGSVKFLTHSLVAKVTTMEMPLQM